MTTEKKKHGGRRAGAGAKKKPKELLKQAFKISLQNRVIEAHGGIKPLKDKLIHISNDILVDENKSSY